MNQLIVILLAIFSVSTTFTIRIFSKQNPTQVTISSSAGSYTIKALNNGMLSVNGKRENYFQQTGNEKYTLSSNELKRSYAGGFTFFSSNGELVILNHISEEDYLASVVSAELPSGGEQVRKAQAILARTYAYKNMGNPDAGYDLLDNQLSQVYRGLPAGKASLEAVRSTEGLVLGYKEEVAEVYYHSTCGGMILLPSDVWSGAKNQPYHKRMIDTFCSNSPFYTWEDTFYLDSIYQAHKLHAKLKKIKLIKDTVGAPVKSVVLLAPDTLRFDYNDFFNALNHRPKTRRFEAELTDSLLILHGHGYGHGVGMCQVGAIAMDKAGANYRDILLHYFPGTQILALSRISKGVR